MVTLYFGGKKIRWYHLVPPILFRKVICFGIVIAYFSGRFWIFFSYCCGTVRHGTNGIHNAYNRYKP